MKAGFFNWHTTVIGAVLAGLMVLHEALQDGVQWTDPAVWVAVAAAIFGFLSKDASKTGLPLVALGCLLLLPGCETLAVQGSLSYLDPDSGAKGGLELTDAGAGWWVRVPWSSSSGGPADGAVVLEGDIPTVDHKSAK